MTHMVIADDFYDYLKEKVVSAVNSDASLPPWLGVSFTKRPAAQLGLGSVLAVIFEGDRLDRIVPRTPEAERMLRDWRAERERRGTTDANP